MNPALRLSVAVFNSFFNRKANSISSNQGGLENDDSQRDDIFSLNMKTCRKISDLLDDFSNQPIPEDLLAQSPYFSYLSETFNVSQQKILINFLLRLNHFMIENNLKRSVVPGVSEVVLQTLTDMKLEGMVSCKDGMIEAMRRIGNSHYLRQLYMQHLSSYIDPIEHQIGEYKFYTIPLEPIINLYLENESILNDIVQRQNSVWEEPSQDDVEYDSIYSGSRGRWLQGSLHFEVYIDEYNLNNANSNNQISMLCVYISCSNIPYKNRCTR